MPQGESFGARTGGDPIYLYLFVSRRGHVHTQWRLEPDGAVFLERVLNVFTGHHDCASDCDAYGGGDDDDDEEGEDEDEDGDVRQQLMRQGDQFDRDNDRDRDRWWLRGNAMFELISPRDA